MIVLTGTTGGLGKSLLSTILQQSLIPPSEIIISTNNPASTLHEPARKAGITIRHGDMTQPSSLVSSYANADTLYLTSYPSVGLERTALHKNCIDAAKAAGMKHVIYTSLVFGGKDGEKSGASVMTAHIETVKYLKSTGMTWTIVREAPYTHFWNNFGGFLNINEPVTELVVSNDGPLSLADRDELGEATAQIVAKWSDYINQSIALTGPELLTVEDVVNKYSAHVKGKPIRFQKVGATAAANYHKQRHSLPPELDDFIDAWATWGEALADGEMEYLDPTFEKLLGRKPKTIDDLASTLFNSQTNGLDTKDFNSLTTPCDQSEGRVRTTLEEASRVRGIDPTRYIRMLSGATHRVFNER